MITEKDKIDVIKLLSKNEVYNLSIIGYIKENQLKRLVHKGDSFLIQGNDGEEWIYLSSANKNEFSQLIKELNVNDKYFGAIDNWQISIVTKDKEIDWLINAFQYHFPLDKQVPENKIEARGLTTKDSEYIVSQSEYKDMLSVEYISNRIEHSISAGIYEDGRLVAWALTHDDSSLGSMHVIEDYRRKGYAREITISLVKHCRAINKIPFLQCEGKNTSAQKLVETVGFVKDRNVSWLKLK